MHLKKWTTNRFFVTAILLCFLNQFSMAQTTPDPGVAGSYTVLKGEYNLGDRAYKPPTFPDSVEVRGSVYYPSVMTAAPFPVLFFMHGRHDVCYDTTTLSPTSLTWPCPAGALPIVSYEGYDYLARNMASHGYIVISISTNCINAYDNGVSDYGMQGRAELLQHHMDLWNTWTTAGGAPFDSLFIGKLNMQNIGTMGHSRGGEGVVYQALYNQSLGSPYGVKAVLTLAPVDFWRHVLHHIPLMDVSPYCDGDVNNLMGVHFYDDSRYSDTTDDAPKHTVLFMGADHNFFNSVWTPGSYISGGMDDWYYTGGGTDPQCSPTYPGNKRFDTTKQMKALLAYAAAFYRVYIGHENAYAPIINVDDRVPPASSTLDSSDVYVAFHPSKLDRLDLNRTDSSNRTTINSLQDTVSDSGLVTYTVCNGGLGMASCGIVSSSAQEPHRGSSGVIGLAELNMQWNDTTEYFDNLLPPAYHNLYNYQDILFRAAVNFHLYTGTSDLNFTIQLIDTFGDVSSLQVGNYTYALFQQPGTQSGDLPKVMFNTIKIPLTDFSGVDLTTVVKVRFLFNQSPSGAVLISDLAFSSKPCNNLYTVFYDSIATGLNVYFNNQTTYGNGDSVTCLWNFGDSVSGTNDTSTLWNPIMHLFSGAGTHNVCLYVQDFKRNSYVCKDTFCIPIVLTPPVGVTELLENKITIVPNPAKDFLMVYGSEKTDNLTLYNVYGQAVFSKELTETEVVLPRSIPTGIYYGVVTTHLGKVVKKIFINR